jgi:hypothetical protein
VATLLTLGINDNEVLTCPIFAYDGSTLAASHPLFNALSKQLSNGYDEKTASYYLVSLASHLDNNTMISAFLLDKNGSIVQQQKAKMFIEKSNWQNQSEATNTKLLIINFAVENFSDIAPDNYVSRVKERVLTALNSEQKYKQSSPCFPIHLFENQAIKNYYGVNKMATIDINAKIGRFILRPDPMEHLFAAANIIYSEIELQNGEELVRKMVEGKKFPILDENEAMLEAIDIGLKKL